MNCAKQKVTRERERERGGKGRKGDSEKRGDGRRKEKERKVKDDRGFCSSDGRCRGEPGLRKLDFELLYYSCQVCSNHVGYFNKREQQGETGSLRPASSSPRPFRYPPLLDQPTHRIFSTASVHHLRLYRDADDPVTVPSPRVASQRRLKILRLPARNGNCHSFEIPFTRRSGRAL